MAGGGWFHDLFIGGAAFATGLAPSLVRACSGRARRFDALEKRIMEKVETRNKDLEAKVAACEEERSEMDTIKLCLRLAVPDMVRRDPTNPVLRLMGDALERSFGPVNADIKNLRALIDQLYDEPGTNVDAIRERLRDIRAGQRDPAT
jgi:hypothetical protein